MIVPLVCAMPTSDSNGETKFLTISIENSEPVHKLVSHICDKWSSYSRNVMEMKPEFITLYKANLPSDYAETWSERKEVLISQYKLMCTPIAISHYFPEQEDKKIHIIVKCTGRQLSCHIYDELVGKQAAKTFRIMVDKDDPVPQLTMAMAAERPDRFAGLHLTGIQLYWAMVRVSRGAMNKPFVLEENRVMASDDLWSLYSGSADHQPTGFIHVIVSIHDSLACKRRDSIELTANRLKKMKIIQSAPSTVSKPLEYQAMQNDLTQKILDDHPARDIGIPPIPLLYPPFGDFLDTVYGVRKVGVVELEQFKAKVDDFADSMTGFFADEGARQAKGLNHINNIFFDCNVWGPRIAPSGILPTPKVQSDGHLSNKHGFPLIVIEFKNSDANVQTHSRIQAIGYVGKLQLATLEEYHPILDKFRMPTLLITVVGHLITFYAAILLDTQYRLVSITPTLSCVRTATDGRDRKTLYLAFMAANTLAIRIMHDIDGCIEKLKELPTIPFARRFLPNITSLKLFNNNGHLKFHIDKRHPQQQDDRELYIATEDGTETQVIIKFTKQYCVALQNLCSTANHAPSVLAYEVLPGGWHAVAMEFIDQPTLDDAVMKWGAEVMKYSVEGLRKLVADFHAKGFVHGDLRGVNILANQKNFWLIDFDWGGEFGEAKYPTSFLTKQLLVGQTKKTDLIIRQEDDDAVLTKTFVMLKLVKSVFDNVPQNVA